MKQTLTILAFLTVSVTVDRAFAGQTDHLFSIESKASPTRVTPGGQGLAEIQIKVKSGAHLSAEAPLKIALAGKNLRLSKESLGRADAFHAGDGARFSIPFVAGPQKGAAAVDAELVFFLCAETICERQSKKLSIPVTIQ